MLEAQCTFLTLFHIVVYKNVSSSEGVQRKRCRKARGVSQQPTREEVVGVKLEVSKGDFGTFSS